MSVRVQVILDESERASFMEQARRESMSLSAWLREAGRERIEARNRRRARTVDELRAFFEISDREETGREPDWDRHLAVIEASRSSGGSKT